jgi:DNA-binding NtrC family response regulator
MKIKKESSTMSILTANVLVAGITEKSKALKELPIRLLVVDTGAEAARCLKEETIHTVVSHWDLIDAWDGELLKRVTAARPSMPTIAFIRPGDCRQEIAARSLGVSAVLSEDVEEDFFRDTVCQLLGISAIVTMKVIDEKSYGTSELSCPDDAILNKQNR